MKSRNNRGNGARSRTHANCRNWTRVNQDASAAGTEAAEAHRRSIGKTTRCIRVQRRGRYHMYRVNPLDDIASLLAMHMAYPRHPGILHLHAEAA